jgi:stage II sporulation protein D
VKDLIQILLLPALLVLALGSTGWKRGPVHDGVFSAQDLTSPPDVRVGLAAALDAASVPIRVDGPVRLLDPPGREVFWEGPSLAERAAPVPAPGRGIRFGNRIAVPLDEVLIVPARDGSLQVGKARYRGALRLLVRGPQRLLHAVNEIDLERYLRGVVASEMKPEWPIEALKAQAVVARSYAVYELLSGYGRQNRGFDLYDDDRSQLYRGIRGESAESDHAVRATYGLVCRYQGRIFKAFYQNTCGGRTESAKVVFLEQDIPPLAGRDCAYCTQSRTYRWRVEVGKEDLAAKLFGPRAAGPVPEVRILESTPGGLVLRMAVKSPGRGVPDRVLTGKEFRSAVDPAKFKSLAFDVSDAGDRFVFEGRGWGHLVGLCQEGAHGFAERNRDATFRQILEYYYPGASAGRIY